jgi:hypothetical protein
MKQLQMLKKGLDLMVTAGLSMFCAVEAHAGFLSQAICRPYKKIIDDELFMWLAVIAATGILIAAKLGSDKGAISKGIGVLLILGMLLSLEVLVASATGKSFVCS